MASEKQSRAYKPPSKKGELRRRWRVFMQDGTVAKLRSEGRLMALYVLYWADFENCTAKFAVRGAARWLGVRPMTAQRGIQQLCEAGMLAVIVKGEGSSDSVFGLTKPTTSGGQPDHEPCAPRPPAVGAETTSGGRSAYERWSDRPQPVVGAPTSRGRLTRIPTGIPIDTSGEFNFSKPTSSCGSEPHDQSAEREGSNEY